MDILELARQNQQRAWEIIENTRIIPIWEAWRELHSVTGIVE